MSQAPHIEIAEFYHVYNRGTDKRKLFLSISDYERFISLLYLANSTKPISLDRRHTSTLKEILQKSREETLVDICTYCLMPNHFHLLIKEKVEGGTSKFMHKLSTGYSMFFNAKYERTGNLFQGKYKARHINNDTDLRYNIAYIHLNPLKLIDPLWKEQGIRNREEGKRFLKSYYYSSFHDFAKIHRPENKIVTKDVLPKYFSSAPEFEDMMYEWLDFHKE